MKIYILLSLSVSFLLVKCQSQNQLTKEQKLTGLAKVWGFVAYNYIEALDEELVIFPALLQLIPAIEETKNDEQYHALLQQFVDTLPEIPKDLKIGLPKGSKQLVDLNTFLVDTLLLTKSLNNKLQGLYSNTLFHDLNIEPAFDFQESRYDTMSFPPTTIRLAMLFTYWNHLLYNCPHVNKIDQNWNEVLANHIPKFITAKNAVDHHKNMLALAKEINDSHAFVIRSDFLHQYFGQYSPPFKLSYLNDKTVVSAYESNKRMYLIQTPRTYLSLHSLGQKSGVKIGDEILAVDGKPIQSLRKELEKLVGGANLAGVHRNVNGLLLKGKTSTVELTISDGKEERTLTVQRYTLQEMIDKQEVVNSDKWLNDTTLYVNMAKIENRESVKEIANSFEKAKKVIFDCRYYPSVAAFRLVDYLIPSKTIFANFYIPTAVKQGWYEPQIRQIIHENDSANLYKGKVIILVNEQTQSAGEHLAMQLQQHPNSFTIGSQTAGSHGMADVLTFPNHLKMHYTYPAVFYPDGTPVQRKGVKIDKTLVPSIQGIRNGKDEVLTSAKKIGQHPKEDVIYDKIKKIIDRKRKTN